MAQEYSRAGYDVLAVHHLGEDQEGFLAFLTDEVMPRL